MERGTSVASFREAREGAVTVCMNCTVLLEIHVLRCTKAFALASNFPPAPFQLEALPLRHIGGFQAEMVGAKSADVIVTDVESTPQGKEEEDDADLCQPQGGPRCFAVDADQPTKQEAREDAF